jgi:AraC-like DNA-binding protein
MSSEAVLVQRDLRAIWAGVQAAGLDVARVAREAGLGEPIEELPLEDLRPEVIGGLWQAIVDVAGDVTMLALVGHRVPLGAYRVIDFLGWACPDVGSAFIQLARYFGLITDMISWTVDDAPTAPVVQVVNHAPDAAAGAVGLQYTLGVTFGRFQAATMGDFVPTRVELQMPEPPDMRRHREVFRCPLVYGCARTVVVFPRSVWQLPLAGASQELKEVLERHAAEMLARRDDGDALARVRAAIRTELPQGPPKLETVASRVAMSMRTLQRRLGDAATTFQTLVEDERREAAKSYLRRPDLAVGEVAYLLGYSEPSAFARAFKRWTGKSPREYRA